MALGKIAINRGIMSGGMNSRQRRREFMRFNKAVDRYNAKLKERDLLLSKTVLDKTSMSISDDRLVLDALPKLKNLQLFLR